MTGVAPICLEYRRLMPEVVGEPIRCEAFPDGIPGPILDSEANHVFAFRGDHGPRFEPVDPAGTIPRWGR